MSIRPESEPDVRTGVAVASPTDVRTYGRTNGELLTPRSHGSSSVPGARVSNRVASREISGRCWHILASGIVPWRTLLGEFGDMTAIPPTTDTEETTNAR